MEMVKAKIRLSFVTIILLVIPLILFLLNIHFSSKLTHNSNNLARELEDTEVAQLRQRRLSQPFAWHQDNEKNEKNSVNLLSEPDLQNSAEGTTPEKPEKETNSSDVIKAVSPSTCRNSVQGQIYIADDRGYICVRRHVISATGCCNVTLSQRYDCQECQEQSGCCKLYEQCISCCMNPKNRPALTSVLHEANALSNILLLSVSDHFELCLAKCRTSSKSVQHENLYINPSKKYCFMKGSPATQDPSSADEGRDNSG